ncbi:MAG TPA: PQQ-dependent sugar dehydrogenase [Abditibacterium sp.]|jgi:glucose/arabinose dehydrogenase
MKRPILFGALSVTLLSALSGCASQAPVPVEDSSPVAASVSDGEAVEAKTVSASKTVAAPAAIIRSEGVPDGVKSPLGLTVPRGFEISVFADNLDRPRRLTFAPGASAGRYDVFVAEPFANRVSVLRVQNSQVRSKSVFTSALNQPYGLAFGAGSFYVANTDSVVRFPFKTGSVKATSAPQKIADLTEGGYNQHWTRNLLFSRDQKKLFVTVGSSCNTCEEDDPQRAAVSVMNPDGSGKKLFATGLRNPVGLAWKPDSNDLYTVVNERDNLGDDVPPDYLTSVKAGAFYGWPYAYTDINRQIFLDPNFGAKAPQMAKKTVAPDVPVQAHSAALGVAFYPTKGGNFPANYSGDAFLAFHGSWNRSAKTGYKIVRVDFQNGQPRTVSDFVTGYLTGNGNAWGRPVDVQIAPDGSLLFSDDDGRKIWRVAYKGNKSSASSKPSAGSS